MSIQAMVWAWEADLKPTAKLLLLAYANHADEEGGSVRPSISRLEKFTGLSRSSVIRNTNELHQSGLLIPDGEHARGRVRRWTMPLSTPVNKCHRDTGVMVTPVSQRHSTSVTMTPGGVTVTRGGCHGDTLKVIEKSEKRQNPLSASSADGSKESVNKKRKGRDTYLTPLAEWGERQGWRPPTPANYGTLAKLTKQYAESLGVEPTEGRKKLTEDQLAPAVSAMLRDLESTNGAARGHGWGYVVAILGGQLQANRAGKGQPQQSRKRGMRAPPVGVAQAEIVTAPEIDWKEGECPIPTE